MQRLELIEKLTTTAGISGQEIPIRTIMENEMKGSAEILKDKMGSIHFLYKGSSSNPKLLFLAHQDEIGFIVADITESGLIKMQAIGGWNAQTLMASPVEIINQNREKVFGIIGSVPVHFIKGNNLQIELEDLFVDIGATSKEEVENKYLVHLGAAIVPVTNFYYNHKNKRIFSKAFDDRIGIAAIIELGNFLVGQNHPNWIYCSGSVQEEVGTRGAKTIANYTDADVAIIVEGAPADDVPGIGSLPQTALGKGVHVRIYDPGMLIHQELRKYICRIAEEYSIPYQLAVRRRGGTDGMQIHTANYGIPTVVLGVPVRYAHSHNCLISLDDYENVVIFLQKIAMHLDAETIQTIF
jgi:endoglucanase